MAIDSCITGSSLGRPIVSEPQDGPAGRTFSIQFAPGQELPVHRNKSRVVITAARGEGTIIVAGDGARVLTAGDTIQLDPDVPHGVVAGDAGLELVVSLVSGCCGSCG
jgi:quercetin dioxygenase-like cupin family protein